MVENETLRANLTLDLSLFTAAILDLKMATILMIFSDILEPLVCNSMSLR